VCKLYVVGKRGLNVTYIDQYIENDMTMTLVESKFHEAPRQGGYARKQKKNDFVIFNLIKIQQIYHTKKKASI